MSAIKFHKARTEAPSIVAQMKAKRANSSVQGTETFRKYLHNT